MGFDEDAADDDEDAADDEEEEDDEDEDEDDEDDDEEDDDNDDHDDMVMDTNQQTAGEPLFHSHASWAQKKETVLTSQASQ